MKIIIISTRKHFLLYLVILMFLKWNFGFYGPLPRHDLLNQVSDILHLISIHLKIFKYKFTYRRHKKRERLKWVLATMYSWQLWGAGTLRYREPRHFSNHGLDLKRQVIIFQFLSINFCFWISSIFVGFFKSSRFFVSPYTVLWHVLIMLFSLVLC